MAGKKNSSTGKTIELVPMQAVKCLVCEGKGRVFNEKIKAHINCRGCQGKGWVEVHMASPAPAPSQEVVDEAYRQTRKQALDMPDWTVLPSNPYTRTYTRTTSTGSALTMKDLQDSIDSLSGSTYSNTSKEPTYSVTYNDLTEEEKIKVKGLAAKMEDSLIYGNTSQ